jgi:hypothetical protein
MDTEIIEDNTYLASKADVIGSSLAFFGFFNGSIVKAGNKKREIYRKGVRLPIIIQRNDD